MAIRLSGKDIVDLWEAIKFACDQADTIGQNRQKYFNTLLCDLLNSKAQCFVRIDKDRKLETIIITKVLIDPAYDEKVLHIQCLYSWTIKNNSVWKEDLDTIKTYAREKECKYISAAVRSARASELATSLGMIETIRTFSTKV